MIPIRAKTLMHVFFKVALGFIAVTEPIQINSFDKFNYDIFHFNLPYKMDNIFGHWIIYYAQPYRSLVVLLTTPTIYDHIKIPEQMDQSLTCMLRLHGL